MRILKSLRLEKAHKTITLQILIPFFLHYIQITQYMFYFTTLNRFILLNATYSTIFLYVKTKELAFLFSFF